MKLKVVKRKTAGKTKVQSPVYENLIIGDCFWISGIPGLKLGDEYYLDLETLNEEEASGKEPITYGEFEVVIKK